MESAVFGMERGETELGGSVSKYVEKFPLVCSECLAWRMQLLNYTANFLKY